MPHIFSLKLFSLSFWDRVSYVAQASLTLRFPCLILLECWNYSVLGHSWLKPATSSWSSYMEIWLQRNFNYPVSILPCLVSVALKTTGWKKNELPSNTKFNEYFPRQSDRFQRNHYQHAVSIFLHNLFLGTHKVNYIFTGIKTLSFRLFLSFIFF